MDHPAPLSEPTQGNNITKVSRMYPLRPNTDIYPRTEVTSRKTNCAAQITRTKMPFWLRQETLLASSPRRNLLYRTSFHVRRTAKLWEESPKTAGCKQPQPSQEYWSRVRKDIALFPVQYWVILCKKRSESFSDHPNIMAFVKKHFEAPVSIQRHEKLEKEQSTIGKQGWIWSLMMRIWLGHPTAFGW